MPVIYLSEPPIQRPGGYFIKRKHGITVAQVQEFEHVTGRRMNEIPARSVVSGKDTKADSKKRRRSPARSSDSCRPRLARPPTRTADEVKAFPKAPLAPVEVEEGELRLATPEDCKALKASNRVLQEALLKVAQEFRTRQWKLVSELVARIAQEKIRTRRSTQHKVAAPRQAQEQEIITRALCVPVKNELKRMQENYRYELEKIERDMGY